VLTILNENVCVLAPLRARAALSLGLRSDPRFEIIFLDNRGVVILYARKVAVLDLVFCGDGEELDRWYEHRPPSGAMRAPDREVRSGNIGSLQNRPTSEDADSVTKQW
jgi:hypothetical protein